MNEDYPEGLEEEEVTEGETPERAGENEFEEGDPIEQEVVDTTFIGSQTNVISQCPVENGAIRTTWGAISGGSVISGIAGKLHSCGEVRVLFVLKSGYYSSRYRSTKYSDSKPVGYFTSTRSTKCETKSVTNSR